MLGKLLNGENPREVLMLEKSKKELLEGIDVSDYMQKRQEFQFAGSSFSLYLFIPLRKVNKGDPIKVVYSIPGITEKVEGIIDDWVLIFKKPYDVPTYRDMYKKKKLKSIKISKYIARSIKADLDYFKDI